MRIKKIYLNNIGPFYGLNKFDLKTDSNKNIVLIGGNNGSGKTTFLNALRIGLYGSHSTGLTTITSNYLSQVEKLMNIKAIKNSESEYYVEIHYTEVENFIENRLILKREWCFNPGLREKVTLMKNGKKLSKSEYIEYISNMKVKNHPKLVSSLLFDGERIARIIEDEEIGKYIEEVFNSTFNLDFYTSMNEDILKYIEKEVKNSTLSEDEIELLDQRTKISGIDIYIKDLNKRLESRKSRINQLDEERNNIYEEFQNHGGLTKAEMLYFREQLTDQEKNKKSNWGQVVEYLETFFPFALNMNLLYQASEKILENMPFQLLELLNYMKTYDKYKDIEFDSSEIETLTKHLTRIHNVDQAAYTRLLDLITQLETKPIKAIKYLFEQSTSSNTDISKLRKDISNSDSDELNKIFKELTSRMESIAKLDIEVKDLQKKIIIQEKELKIEQSVMELKEKKLFSSKKSLNSFTLANKIMRVNTLFKNKTKETKLADIENLTTAFFRNVINKSEFIEKIKINRDDFNLELYSFKNELIPTALISAGEKQVLMGCLIKAIYELSKRTMPLVFDTPLARLDSLNRKSFVKEIISKSGDQVIVLSTDEEIIGSLKADIDDRIKRTYLLKNNGVDETKVVKSYFKGDKK